MLSESLMREMAALVAAAATSSMLLVSLCKQMSGLLLIRIGDRQAHEVLEQIVAQAFDDLPSHPARKIVGDVVAHAAQREQQHHPGWHLPKDVRDPGARNVPFMKRFTRYASDALDTAKRIAPKHTDEKHRPRAASRI